MSADKKMKKPQADQFTGRVVLKPFGSGSKSEHDAVCMITNDAEYVLRRPGGNPFHDPVLHRLQGKCITVRGMIHNYTLFVKEIVDEKP